MKSINEKAPVIAKEDIIINAPMSKVWGQLTAITEWVKWQRDIEKVEIDEELMVGSEFTWKSGGVNIKSKVHTLNGSQAFGWTGKTMGILAVHNWYLEEVSGEGVRVEVEESMEGILAFLFKGMMVKSLRRGMVTWLRYLKESCEAER